MWLWRRMIETQWIRHKTNEAALNEVSERRINVIMKEKIKLIEEHLLRHNPFITVIMEGEINGKRLRITFFEQIFPQRVNFIS